jgi:hypothetical protein
MRLRRALEESLRRSRGEDESSGSVDRRLAVNLVLNFLEGGLRDEVLALTCRLLGFAGTRWAGLSMPRWAAVRVCAGQVCRCPDGKPDGCALGRSVDAPRWAAVRVCVGQVCRCPDGKPDGTGQVC